MGAYDNSVATRGNPAPHKEVYLSEPSWDERYVGVTDIAIDKRDRRLMKQATTDELGRDSRRGIMPCTVCCFLRSIPLTQEHQVPSANLRCFG